MARDKDFFIHVFNRGREIGKEREKDRREEKRKGKERRAQNRTERKGRNEKRRGITAWKKKAVLSLGRIFHMTNKIFFLLKKRNKTPHSFYDSRIKRGACIH